MTKTNITKIEGHPLHRTSSRGKRYVYLRGTNIALVRGFEGSDDELNVLLSSPEIIAMIRHRDISERATIAGWRMDTAKALHRGTEKRAKAYERTYSLSIDAINTVLIDADDRCELTGIRFDYGPKTDTEYRVRPETPSLDRINNKLGYDLNNIRVVCVCVNFAINEWGLKNFERMCRAYVKQNG